MADAYTPRFARDVVDSVDRTRVSLSPTDGVVVRVRIGDEFIDYNVEQLRLDAVEAAPGHIIPPWTFVSISLLSKTDEFETLELSGTVERSRPLFTVSFAGIGQTDRERLAAVLSKLAEARHERTGVTRVIREVPDDAVAKAASLERQLEELRAELSRVAFDRDELRRELDDYRREATALVRQLRDRLALAESAKREAQRQRTAMELMAGTAEHELDEMFEVAVPVPGPGVGVGAGMVPGPGMVAVGFGPSPSSAVQAVQGTPAGGTGGMPRTGPGVAVAPGDARPVFAAQAPSPSSSGVSGVGVYFGGAGESRRTVSAGPFPSPVPSPVPSSVPSPFQTPGAFPSMPTTGSTSTSTPAPFPPVPVSPLSPVPGMTSAPLPPRDPARRRASLAGTALQSALHPAMSGGVNVVAGLEILNLHAQGGMAEVYRARGPGIDGRDYTYAVKRILPEHVRDPAMRQMFIEESRIATRLTHPNIVRVYDLATSDHDDLFIVMEFLDGIDLAGLGEAAATAGVHLPVWFAVHVAHELLHALSYVAGEARDAHGQLLHLIHRDISPHNVFICNNGSVKLMDFGVAKTDTSLVKTQVGVTKGKLGYMSPEQLANAPLDPRSDLYNVGILLYEMIAGEPLFGGESTADFLKAMVRGLVPPFAPHLNVPVELAQLVAAALAREPQRRPPSALHFNRELLRISQQYALDAHAAHVAQLLRDLGLATHVSGRHPRFTATR